MPGTATITGKVIVLVNEMSCRINPSIVLVTCSIRFAVRKLAEKERAIAQQYRAAARQAIHGMQADVLRTLARHDDLRTDGFLPRVRRIIPSEYLAAWAAWSGIFTLIDASNDVMFAMWAAYSVLALGYVYLQLVKDRRAKDAVYAAALPREISLATVGGESMRGAGARGTAGTMRLVSVKAADTLSIVASGMEAVSVSRSDKHMGVAEGMDTVSGDEESESEGMSTVDEEPEAGPRRFGRRPWRGGRAGGGRGPRREEAEKRNPGNGQLFLQAVVSALAFLLLSAFAAGIHSTIGAPVWVFFAPVAPFVLFAQFVLPDGLVSR